MAQIDKLVFWSKPFAIQLSRKIKKWVLLDMRKGILQGAQDTYKSKQYVKYKNNYMKRFTTRTYKKGTKHISPGTIKRKGTKVLPYEGVSIKSNWTKSVNMMLTGQLIAGLKYLKSDKVSLWMTYNPNDGDKIKNNEAMFRNVRGLNSKNIRKVKKAIIKEFNENKKKLKDIVISVGK